MIIPRDDGSRQWAFRKKPLYTYIQDLDDADDGAGKEGSKRPAFNDNAKGHEVEGRAIVELQPASRMKLPLGITVAEIRTASGQVLSTPNDYPLYTFDGMTGDSTAERGWSPVEAPQLALPVGDFSILARGDGMNQWVYRVKPLYRFDGDLLDGD